MRPCFHCGLPAVRFSFLLAEERGFCCAGCEAVAHAIVDGGFAQYYATRTQPAVRPKDVSPAMRHSNGNEAALILEGVQCSACLWLIEQVLRRVRGVTEAHVNYSTRRARVTWDPSATDLAGLVAAIRAVGYDAVPYEARREDAVRRRERRTALARLFVAGFGAMQGMMYAFPAYVGAGELSADAASLMRWAGLLITIPVVAFACRPFFDGAARELRARRIGLETPIALGIAGGFAASAWATFTDTGDVYFDSIGMLAFLLLAARSASDAAARRASAALDRLMRWTPSAAFAPGEICTVAPGERVPADGIVESGESSADQSLLTGESAAVRKRPGDALVAGSVNLEQPLAMRVTRAGSATQAAAIARLAERAAASRPRLVDAVDRLARGLTVAVLLVAAGAGIAWASPWIAVAVLVATCPCALGLAAPMVLTRANGWLLARGVLVTRSSAHETLEKVTDVVLDKTGTLTLGRPTVTGVHLLADLDERACLERARALEASCRHPIARAFGEPGSLAAEAARHFAGQGVEARIGALRYRIGTAAFCAELRGQAAPCKGGVFLASEHAWLAAFHLEDELRHDAAELIATLRKNAMTVHLASGDDPVLVERLARRLGVARWQGGMRPEAKHDYVARLQGEGRVVAMVGDGLNDAPVLALADVSFAMGSGADAAQLRADVILTGDRLSSVSDTFGIARAALHLVRQNFAWALAYNAVALPLAALGWIGPWQAALGMGASSLIVLANASRPLARKEAWKASTSSYPSPSLSYS